ncbi:hypothetical protein SAMN06265339_1412 [Desulfurobacterium pacificum]|jgi:hypothetical protein|uniref:PilZ domain-containing protein n=1 Tax=Desulfurobacterium pacificum TaxID=240166 RepID=A0ABY1NQZ0_9BACT|nr:hypothetical protein [Desulfurobacterium pacificum]SMP15746.1 hypothetical protein SAMN06265339_1412 [Desulfurobacterium pacificum]
MKIGKRYDGIYYYPFRCKGSVNSVNIPIFFSFRVKHIENNSIIADRFSPPGVESVLSGKEIFLLKEITDNGDIILLKATVIEFSKGKAKIEVNTKEKFKENRSFDRYSFCPEHLGPFEILSTRKERLGDAYINNLSLSGAELFTLTIPSSLINVGDTLLISQDNRMIKLQVLRKRENEARHILFFAGKIIETNFNLMSYLIHNYIKVVKAILKLHET